MKNDNLRRPNKESDDDSKANLCEASEEGKRWKIESIVRQLFLLSSYLGGKKSIWGFDLPTFELKELCLAIDCDSLSFKKLMSIFYSATIFSKRVKEKNLFNAFDSVENVKNKPQLLHTF